MLVATAFLCQLHAIQLSNVVYVTSIKRTSVLMSICLSYLFLKEGGIKERFAGATVMVTGAIITTI